MKLPTSKDFTARKNPGLVDATLRELEVDATLAEALLVSPYWLAGDDIYKVQGDLVALAKLTRAAGPTRVLISFQSYVDGTRYAVFRVYDDMDDPLNE